MLADLLHFPADMAAATVVFLVLSTLVTSVIGAVFGVGGGTILLALLALMLPPIALIPIHGIVQLGATASRTWFMRRHIQRQVVLPFLVGTALGSALSGVLFIQLPPWLIQYLVAAFILWSVVGSFPAIGNNHIVAAGAFSGFLTMLFGATGPFVSAFVKSMGFSRMDHVGTHAALMSLQHVLKIAVFGVLGFAFGPYALLVALMIAGGILGSMIGRGLLSRMSDRNFKPVLNVILVLLALRLAWKATESLLSG